MFSTLSRVEPGVTQARIAVAKALLAHFQYFSTLKRVDGSATSVQGCFSSDCDGLSVPSNGSKAL